MNATTANIDDIVEEFAFLDDWEERYRHLISLGKTLPGIEESERTDANRVKGCVSQVWLVTDVDAEPPRKMAFRGDSDAYIVRGLAAILARLYTGRTPSEVLEVDAAQLLDRLGLDEHLSPQRSNGLRAMVERIRGEAAALQRSGANP